jgi:hypothetical protein
MWLDQNTSYTCMKVEWWNHLKSFKGGRGIWKSNRWSEFNQSTWNMFMKISEWNPLYIYYIIMEREKETKINISTSWKKHCICMFAYA